MKFPTGFHSARLPKGAAIAFLLAIVGNLSGQVTDSRPAQPTPARPTTEVAPRQEKLTPAQTAAIQIPKDAEGPIFVYDLTGGYRMTAPRGQKPTPKFQLFSDGRIVARGGNPPVPDVETKFSEAELTEFLDFVVNQNQFYELDMASVIREMESIKGAAKIADAPTTTFSINLEQGKKESSAYALLHSIQRFPENEPLQQLARIERRCNRIVSKIHLADDGPMVLEFVNAAIGKQKPDFAPVTMGELRLATRFPNGKLQVSFERLLPVHDGGPGRKANVIFFRLDKDAVPVVKFYGFPQK